MTLFGEEIVPDAPKPAPKTRAKKGDNDAQTEETSTLPDIKSETEEEIKEVVSEDIVIPTDNTEISADTTAIITATPVAVATVVAISEQWQEEATSDTANSAEYVITSAEKPGDLPEDLATPLSSPVTVETAIATTETERAITTPGAEENVLATPVQTIAVAEKTKQRTAKKSKEIADGSDEEIADGGDVIAEDWKGEKQYYSIGEVAGFFKVKTSHIRFWTNEFKLKVRTTRKGDRLFTADQVKEIRTIYHLVKERGFTLSGAKSKLKTQNKRDVTTLDLKTSLLHLKNKLVILRNELG